MMLFGLAMAVFTVALEIFRRKVLVPRIQKMREQADAVRQSWCPIPD
jgi:hypothetical protein